MHRSLAPILCLIFAACAAALPASQPQKIVVYGGTGNIGQRIVREALARGDEVTVVVRDPSPMGATDPRLRVLRGDVLDSAQVARTVAGADVVICAVSFRKPAPNFAGYREAAVSLIDALRSLGPRAPRLIVVGGAGSLVDASGKPVAARIPAAYRGEIDGQKEALDYYRTVKDVAWTYFSPAFSIYPGKRTGKFRLGHDRLITDAKGQSRISMEDYAVAVMNEAEHPKHIRQRFTIGY
ncbi:MAG TPA: NAD(P)H-binding protein [Steroidobacteraceae bacterium]|nr:NAD(P)H-binding protein [Steroidobacteraceae bacterium]